MTDPLAHLARVLAELRRRHRTLRRSRDAGYSTEAVLVTALLAAAALIVLGIIATKVIAKANSIDLG
jgi:hypothetical protein